MIHENSASDVTSLLTNSNSEEYGDFLDARDNGSSSFVPSRNIVVENSHFANSGRMGLALTNVDGFTFTNSYLGNVPEAGIDLETNSVES
jgi:hypothetical protein